MHCSAFEISVVNDSGGFDVKECVGDFYTAKSKMYSMEMMQLLDIMLV